MLTLSQMIFGSVEESTWRCWAGVLRIHLSTVGLTLVTLLVGTGASLFLEAALALLTRDQAYCYSQKVSNA